MASVNKNFVVRNGLEVNTDLIYADIDTRRVGIGLSLPAATFHVVGEAIINPQLTITDGGSGGTLNAGVVQSTTVNSTTGNFTNLFSTFPTFTNLNVTNNLDVGNQLTFGSISGDGEPLSGIVTQIVAGPGIEIAASEDPGKGVVEISSFAPVGKTVFVTQNGDDTNSGLSEADAKRTIKAAASVALTRDTIKIYPGVYVEDNPIILNELVSVEGTELRNIVVTPRFPEKDMFYVNNGCHITDLSFIGQDSEDGAAIIALEKLLGTKEDRYFDAARMIRYNLDHLAKESVEWLHSGYSGFAGDHLAQDAARKINENIEYIAAETVGFLTAATSEAGSQAGGYIGDNGQPFYISFPTGVRIDPVNCEDDVKDVLRSLTNDLKAGSNKRSIGAAGSYFDPDAPSGNQLLHIGVDDENGNSVAQATVDAFDFALGIATHIANNQDWSASSLIAYGTTSFANVEIGDRVVRGIYQDLSYEPLPGDCTTTLSVIEDRVGIVTNTIQAEIDSTDQGLVYLAGITTTFGVNLDVFNDCVDDVKDIWKRIIFDLTRGGNSEAINAGYAYYDDNFVLIPEILKNPGEVEQTIATLDHSFELTRAIVNNACYGGLDQRASSSPVLAGVQTSRYKVLDATYDNHCGIVTVFIGTNDSFETPVSIAEADVRIGDPIQFSNLIWGCDSGGGFSTAIFPDLTNQTNGVGGNYYGDQFCIFNFTADIDPGATNAFGVLVGPSTIPHYHSGDITNFTDPNGPPFNYSSGVIEKKALFNITNSQVMDDAIQNDVSLGCSTFYPQGLNKSIAGCKNVMSTVRNLVGVVTSIIGLGATSGITSSFPGNRGEGIPFSNVKDVTAATYDNVLGRAVITVPNLNAEKGDRIEIKDLIFSCSSGGGPTSEQVFPSGTYGYRFYIDEVNGDDYTLNVGVSSLPHTYERGGYVIDRTFNVNAAPYDNVTGIVTITAPGSYVKRGDIVTIRDLLYDCDTGGQAIFPNKAVQTEYGGKFFGFDFEVVDVVTDRLYNATNLLYDNVTGVTTITVTDSNFSVAVDDLVEIRDFELTCSSGAQTTPIYPTGKFGYVFKVYEVNGNDFTINVGTTDIPHTYVSGGTVRNVTYNDGGVITQSPKSNTFTLNVGVSTIGHTYNSGGYIIPPYSPGVGPITQGPYIRNCTNFVGKSIGMRVDGFDAEPGFEDDIGVTGTMSVDSYTQYNQGGIGVSITNGAYSQLVSIFTICDDIAIFTGQGGQCDLTNSNASFGRLGLFSQGVGDQNTKSIYHTTGFLDEDADLEQDTVVVAGVGTYRPYDGQALYFGELFKRVERLEIVNGGSGYSELVPPQVTIESPPEDAFGITAEGSVNVDPNTGAITSIDVISEGSQYRGTPIVTIDPPPIGSGGVQATAQAIMAPIYYYIESATLPYNNGVTGISTIVLTQLLNSPVPEDTIVYFTRVSLQITSSHSFEWVGAGNDINKAKPALGGVVIQENEVVQEDGGIVVYTSTDQAGNFKIGDDLTINQVTGTITGRAFSQSLLQTVTPLIIALGR